MSSRLRWTRDDMAARFIKCYADCEITDCLGFSKPCRSLKSGYPCQNDPFKTLANFLLFSNLER